MQRKKNKKNQNRATTYFMLSLVQGTVGSALHLISDSENTWAGAVLSSLHRYGSGGTEGKQHALDHKVSSDVQGCGSPAVSLEPAHYPRVPHSLTSREK